MVRPVLDESETTVSEAWIAGYDAVAGSIRCPYDKGSILALAWKDGRRDRKLEPAREAERARWLASFGPTGPCVECGGDRWRRNNSPKGPSALPCERCNGTGVEPATPSDDAISGWRVTIEPHRSFIGSWYWSAIPVLLDGTGGPSSFGGFVGGGTEDAARKSALAALAERGLTVI